MNRGAGSMLENRLTVPDADLLRRYRATRCQDAFAQIVARHSGMVYRTCLRLVGNAADAEDAAQATFIILSQRAEVVTEMLAGWLHKVARDVALNLLRGRGRRAGREQAAAALRPPIMPAPDPLLGIREELDAALTRLPAPLREAVVLRYLEGHDQEQAAQLAGCPRGTLSRRASEGLDQLRSILARRGTLVAPAVLLGFLAQEASATAAAPVLVVSAAGASPAVLALGQGTTVVALTTKVKAGLALGAVLSLIGLTWWLARPAAPALRQNSVMGGRGTYTLVCAPDGQTVISGGVDDIVMVFDPAVTGQQARNLLNPGGAYSLALSADGKSLAVGSFLGALTVWDLPERKKRFEVPAHIRNTVCVAYAPDGKTIATGGHDGRVRVWDAASGTKVAEFTGDKGIPVKFTAPSTQPGGPPVEMIRPDHIVWSVAYSPDSRLLACGGREGTVRVFDLATRAELAALRGHAELVYCVRFAPNGKLLASAAGDKTVRLWDLTSFTEQAVLQGHQDIVHGVAFSPNGQLLASGSFDGRVKLWDVARKQERATIKEPGYTMKVYAVAFTPDGKSVVASGESRMFALWPIADK